MNPAFPFMESGGQVGDVQVGKGGFRLLSFKSWQLFSGERLSILHGREALIKCALLCEELYV